MGSPGLRFEPRPKDVSLASLELPLSVLVLRRGEVEDGERFDGG